MFHILQNHYVWLLLFTAGLYIVLAFVAWKHRSTIGAKWFALFLLAAGIWPLGYAFEVASTTLRIKIFWIQVQYIGIVSMPPFWLAFALHYVGKEHWLTRRTITFLAFGSLITLLLVWTNEIHHWVWAEFKIAQSGQPLERDYTAYYWVHITSSYSLLLFAVALLIRQFIGSPYLYQKQILALLVGVMVPWAVNLLRVSGKTPPQIELDFTPLVLALSSLPFTWSLFQFRLLDVLPRAHNAIFQSMTDGVLVVDANNRIVHINPAAKSIFADSTPNPVGQPVKTLLGAELTELPIREDHRSRELLMDSMQGRRFFEVRILPLIMHTQRLNGDVVVLRDITARKAAQAERDQLIDQLREALFRTQALYRATRSMISVENLPTVLQAVVDGVASALKANRVTVVTIDFEERRITNFLKGGPGAHLMRFPSYADLAKGLTGWVVRESQLARIPKYTSQKKEHETSYERHGELHSGSMMVAPISFRGEIIGALSAFNRPDDPDFTQRDGQLLMAMANQAAIAIANTRLFNEVQRRAITDELTELNNRRHFFVLAEQEFGQAIGSGEPLSAIMFDIDHFKSFNDNYGHAIGDEVLRCVANTTRQSLRGSDVIGRYGGEEFAIILPDTDLSIAYKVAQRLRKQVESHSVQTIYGPLSVTISLGVAHITPEVTTLAHLLEQADQALYCAKKNGRNRVAMAKAMFIPA
ncbi:MAG: histidine kinase N-terminal 7TM domain-containing protein [Ardenticatenaceae bacterium]